MRRLSLISMLLTFVFIFIAMPVFGGDEAENRVKVLDEKLTGLIKANRLEEAIPLAEELLKIMEKRLKPDDFQLAGVIFNLAVLYDRSGRYARAEPLLYRVLKIVEKTSGPEHADTAGILNKLGEVRRKSGRLDEAEVVLKKAIDIRINTLGEDNPLVGQSINNLAQVYADKGRYDLAEPLFLKAIKIFEKNLNPMHPLVALVHNNLGVLYLDRGQYDKSEDHCKKALAIWEKSLGAEHPNTAMSLNNLAEIKRATANFEEAESLYLKALEIRRKRLGNDHPDVAQNLNNIADLYREIGEYAKAEKYYLQSIGIIEKKLGKNHPDMAMNLNNQAHLNYQLGDYEKAVSLMKKALAIQEKAYGDAHPGVLISLSNLAALYMVSGDFERSEKLFNRVLSIVNNIKGEDSVEEATALNNLADLYRRKGEYGRSEEINKNALAIRETRLGGAHPDVAVSLNNLGKIKMLNGEPNAAESYLKRSLEILEKTMGEGHPNTSRCLNNLSLLYAMRGDYTDSLETFKTSLNIDERVIDNVMAFTSEDRKIKFLAEKREVLDGFLSLVVNHLLNNREARREAMDIWLRRKGIVLEAQQRFQEALVYSDNPEAMKIFKELAQVRARLSRLFFSGPGKGGAKAHRERIAGLESEKKRLEAELSKLSSAYADKKKVDRVDSKKLARALPDQSLLLEFSRIGIYDFHKTGPGRRWKPDRYIVFILDSAGHGTVDIIDLGDAGTIDKAAAQLRKAVSDPGDSEGFDIGRVAGRLYDLVFSPIKNKIGTRTEIYISPDGELNLIPFEILQGPDGRLLIEDYTFNYLAAGRDILGFSHVKKTDDDKGGVILVGDPDYDLDEKERQAALTKLRGRANQNADRGKGSFRVAAGLRDLEFTPLPGTRREVLDIKEVFGERTVELFTGEEALEEVLRRESPPEIIHLATHGFFLTGETLKNIEHGLDPSSPGVKKGGGGSYVNPLLLSGLAMAGANSALKSGDGNSDGILTAEKVLGLRLRGADLVVLSACQTGLGEVKSGEGVFGLRRAFSQAGAESMIMSMWPVPDLETKELMVRFYENLMSGRMNRARALREAALHQKSVCEERYGYANPIFWGGFIFIGQPD